MPQEQMKVKYTSLCLILAINVAFYIIAFTESFDSGIA